VILRSNQLSLLGFGAALVLGWICYQQSFSGPLQLDDVSNLGGLSAVHDLTSAADFVLSGDAGPLGRPIALASFALQAEHWAEGARAFLQFNVLLHMLNAIVLAWVLFQLSLLRETDRPTAMAVACAAAAIWVVMPLLATASLLVVQRMTTLAALFSLLGLATYLSARRRLIAGASGGLIGMSASLVIATTLGAFTKESGLLLPVFVLIIEATLIERPTTIAKGHWRAWHAVFLLLPACFIVGYLMNQLSYPDWLVARRDFNVWERLMTEARVLWVYLQKAAFGLPSSLGIYQSSPVIARGILEPLTLLAVLAWVGCAATAIVWRRRYPLFAFAVLFFLGGHLIESTVVPLELYFEHRNYLAIVGPLFAICSVLFLGKTRLRQIAAIAVSAYVLLSAWFLFTFASLWGDAHVASQYWAARYPDSVRAMTNLATYQLADKGAGQTIATLRQFAADYPAHTYINIQALNIACIIASDIDRDQMLADLRENLPHVDFTYSANSMLSQLYTTTMHTQCANINADTVEDLANILRSNPRYVNEPLYNQMHHILLARIAVDRGVLESAIHNLEKAIEYLPSAELNYMMATLLLSAGDIGAAIEFVDDAEQKTPRNPMRAYVWRRSIDSVRAHIDANQAARAGNTSTEAEDNTGSEQP
jgi:hypothetical protein